MNCFLRWLGTLFHCANRLHCVSQLSVDLSMWFAGSEKVNCSDEFEEAAILLALSRFDCVRWAIGSSLMEGWVLQPPLEVLQSSLEVLHPPLELLLRSCSPLGVVLGWVYGLAWWKCLWDITWCFIEDCSEALNCKELCVAVVRCSICFDGDGERQKAVDDSIGGCKCGY